MLNHVKNRVEVIGTPTQVKRVFAFIKGEKEVIDFNSIIPQPMGIDKTISGNTREVKEQGWIWVLRYGYPSWYEWRCDKWGTKWNAYDVELIDDNIVEFDTAWAAPFPVIERLAELFPQVTFRHKWADEDTAHNCGIASYVNGERISEYLPEGGSKEAYELAFDLRPNIEEYFELVDGEYRWKEDE